MSPCLSCSESTALQPLLSESIGYNGIGFLYQNNTLQSLQPPGGGLTFAYGVNNALEVVGLFPDASDNEHGFSWVPSN